MSVDRVDPSVTGAFNFRDLGGLKTIDGREIRSGLFFRSDTLQALTDADVRSLVDTLGVELIVDLRSGAEAVEQGRGPLATEPVCYLNAPLRDAQVSTVDPARQVIQYYVHTLTSSASLLAMVVRTLAAVAGRPFVVHCAAGKDRTGLVTALVLSVLGVDPEEIVRDYLASGPNMPRIVKRFREWPRYREHMAAVPPQLYETDEYTVRALLHHLSENHGGAGGWAAAHGVPPELVDRMKVSLLQPLPG